MINLYDLGQVYIVCGRTDMRRGIDGLAAIVKDKFDLDPFAGKVFIFVVAVVIALKLYIGLVKVIGSYIRDSKMAR